MVTKKTYIVNEDDKKMEKFIDLKYLLLKKFSYIEDLSVQKAQEVGCAGKNLTMMTRILTIIVNDEHSISSIAKLIGISRQATHKNITELVDNGYAYLQDDEYNKKVKIVKITQDGIDILALRREVLSKLQKDIEDNIGKENYEKLIDILQKDW
jgi:DNA-binding MarR family transcriptional regulator